ncbi:MAG: type I restriction enzyme HsdR N-terminal domain-containing protein [Lewinellaceae bacterium]|nr:type I restriction enzyme HsdR N-terminal domain-containing protein [Lewinellaceae bacterium]
MLSIDLLAFQEELRIRKEGEKRYIFDFLRKKWLVLQPEEWVRQLAVLYLVRGLDFPAGQLAIERGIRVNTRRKRCDILVYDRQLQPFLLVECKAPQVSLNAAVFQQAATYNLPLQVPYFFLTNGRDNFCCQLDYTEGKVTELAALPAFP